MARSLSTLLLFLLMLRSVSASAQSAGDCAQLMKFGVYDKFKTFTSESQYKLVKSFFSSNQFNTRQQAESKAGSLGLDIKGILGLQLDGKSADSNFEQWQQALIKSSYVEASAAGLQAQNIETISGAMTNLVATCLTQKGLHAYVIPANDQQNFSVTLEYVPPGNKLKTHGTITISPASVAATCSPAAYLGAPVDIGPAGVSVSCRRVPTETVTITTNTDDGSPIVRYEAYVTPKPTVSFSASPPSIDAGQTATLSWTVTNAARVELEGSGEVALSGTKTVNPPNSMTYRLIVTSLDFHGASSFLTVNVNPPPPVFTGASVFFRTTDNDKDEDTNVTVSIKCGGNTIASTSGTWGHWDDNSDHGWFGLSVVERPRKAAVDGACQAIVVEAPHGHDEWHFNWSLSLNFSDGTTKRYDWTGGNVDYDRTTIVQPMP